MQDDLMRLQWRLWWLAQNEAPWSLAFESELAGIFNDTWQLTKNRCSVVGATSPLCDEEAEVLAELATHLPGDVQQMLLASLEIAGEVLAVAWDGEDRCWIERPLRARPALLVWHATFPCGVGGLLSAAFRLIEQCVERNQALLIDWSGPCLLYHGWDGCNLWDEFFKQPAAALLPSRQIHALLKQDKVSVFAGLPFSFDSHDRPHPGNIERGKLLCQRFARPRPEIVCLVHDFARIHLHGLHQESCWLAVHIRRSDKGCESPENLRLTPESIAQAVLATCHSWSCGGVFICSDDWDLKLRVQKLVEAGGVPVVVYRPALSAQTQKPTHRSHAVAGHRKVFDVLFEILVMAHACCGLLSTHSTVSDFVIFFSAPDYMHRTFWDEAVRIPKGMEAVLHDSAELSQLHARREVQMWERLD